VGGFNKAVPAQAGTALPESVGPDVPSKSPPRSEGCRSVRWLEGAEQESNDHRLVFLPRSDPDKPIKKHMFIKRAASNRALPCQHLGQTCEMLEPIKARSACLFISKD